MVSEWQSFFLAPTKPLVSQQIDACVGIMGISRDHTAHLEGSVPQDRRSTLWRLKRVFFCTPQTLDNDLKDGRCDAASIVCIVIDEAHRATGNYAYTTALQELMSRSDQFRVLALSATPGTDARKVQSVIRNLLISHIEIRTEEDPEIVPYIHQRQIEHVMCARGIQQGLAEVRKQLNGLIQLPLQCLRQCNIVDVDNPNALNFLVIQDADRKLFEATSTGSLSSFLLNMLSAALEEVKALMKARKALGEGSIHDVLAELLHTQKVLGSQRSTQQPALHIHSHNHHQDRHLHHHQQNQQHLQYNSSLRSVKFESVLECLRKSTRDAQYLERRHPKIAKLKEVLQEHFSRHQRAGSSTRALVFSQLRTTVMEIKSELADVPGVAAHEFVGQGISKSLTAANVRAAASAQVDARGQNQAEQAEVLRRFNAGEINVLVATSIAEEGLDIAEVDLIVFFEVVASPIRLVQRCGRTGRKRSGKVVMLVSTGEADKVEKSSDNASSITKTLRNASRSMQFYTHNPPMLPADMPAPALRMQNLKTGEVISLENALAKKPPLAPISAVPSSSPAATAVSFGPNAKSELRGGDLMLQKQQQRRAAGGDIAAFFQPVNYSNKENRTPLNQSVESAVFDFTFDDDDAAVLLHPLSAAVADDIWIDYEPEEQQLYQQQMNQNRCDQNTIQQQQQQELQQQQYQKQQEQQQQQKQHAQLKNQHLLWGPEYFQTHDHNISNHLHNGKTGLLYNPPDTTAMVSLKSEPVTIDFAAEPNVDDIYGWDISTQDALAVTIAAEEAESSVESGNVRDSSSSSSDCAESKEFVKLEAASNLCEGVQQLREEVSAPFVATSCQFKHSNDPFSFSSSSNMKNQQALDSSLITTSSNSNCNPICRSINSIDSQLHVSNACSSYRSAATGRGTSIKVEAPQLRRVISSVRSSFVPFSSSNFDAFKSFLHCHNKVTDATAGSSVTTALRPALSTAVSLNTDEVVRSIDISAVTSDAEAKKGAIVLTDAVATTVDDKASSELAEESNSDGGDSDTAGRCCICLSWKAFDDDPIVFCDGWCGSGVHVSCYGLFPNHQVPEDEFFCESCAVNKNIKNHCSEERKPKCSLCFRKDGLMKRCSKGSGNNSSSSRGNSSSSSSVQQWAHPVCVLFTPELAFDSQCRPADLQNVDVARKQLLCKLCSRVGGACVQCHHSNCLTAFHPFCSYSNWKQMIIRCGKGDRDTTYELYCDKHRHRAKKTPDVYSSLITFKEDCEKYREKKKKQQQQQQLGGTKRKALLDGKQQTSAEQQKKRKNRSIYDDPAAARFFDLEAVESPGSDASAAAEHDREGEGEDGDDDSSAELSGDFINDGSITQRGHLVGAATQFGMYLAANVHHQEMQSPDEFVDGKLVVRHLVRAGAVSRRNGIYASGVKDTPCTIIRSADNSSSFYTGSSSSSKWDSGTRSDVLIATAAAADTPLQTDRFIGDAIHSSKKKNVAFKAMSPLRKRRTIKTIADDEEEEENIEEVEACFS